MERSVKNLIIGGGQAGLSTSYHLQQLGQESLVLEAASQPAHAWRNDRWDSFTFVTPNWTWKLPGAEYVGQEPDGYMPRSEIVQRLEKYIEKYSLPVQYETRAERVEPEDGGYRVETSKGAWKARNVIVSTGVFQEPKIPPISRDLPEHILQLPSGKYRNPDLLPAGAVLVVGSAQSGCQIAEELYQSGRKVYLSVGKSGRVPRRYRGRDIVGWMDHSGFMKGTVDKLPSRAARFAGNPQATGKGGGHTINLHRFYRDGVTLVGHLQGVQEDRVFFSTSLNDCLAFADKFEEELLKNIDTYIQVNGLDAPPEKVELLRDAYSAPEIPWLDLIQAGVNTVIWATGYRFDYSLVKAPVFDEVGYPVADWGISSQPGLYFAGFPWLPHRESGLLLGVAHVTAKIAENASLR